MKKLRRPEPSGNGKFSAPHPSSDSSATQKPHFSLEFLVKGFTLTECDKDQRSAFAMALQERASLSWVDIGNSGRKGLGSEKIHSLNVPITDTIMADKRDKIVSFRFGGNKERFLGYRDGRVLYIVWVDPGGRVYDHG